MKIKQINASCYGCSGPLNESKTLIETMENAAIKSGAKVIGNGLQSYPVHGLTAIVFLAESHLLVTTYPELNFAAVEISMCGQHVYPERCLDIINQYLKPKHVGKHEFYQYIEKQ